MRVADRVRWEARTAAQLRILEDCLQRALDGLENIPDSVEGIGYVRKQVDLAHDAAINVAGAVRVLMPEAGIV